jgi:hypothetical protein
MALNRIISATFKTAFSAHIALTGSSLAYGALASGASPIEDMDANELSTPASALVLETVTQMYSGHGCGVSNIYAKRFAKHVVFEDPAAKCVGVHEIGEAFRAMQLLCSPQCVKPPRIIANAATLDREGWGNMVVLELHQSYFTNRLLRVNVKSYVIVEVDEKGLIKRIEERWNGASLMNTKPFAISRRLNGLISYACTSFLLRGG